MTTFGTGTFGTGSFGDPSVGGAGTVAGAALLSGDEALVDVRGVAAAAAHAGSEASTDAGASTAAAQLSAAEGLTDSGAGGAVTSLAAAEASAEAGGFVAVALAAGSGVVEPELGDVASVAVPVGAEALTAEGVLTSVASLAGANASADSGTVTSVAVPPSPPQPNLLTGTDADFETSLGTWASSGTSGFTATRSLTRESGWSHGGSWAARSTGTNGSAFGQSLTAFRGGIPASPGLPYSIEAFVNAIAPGNGVGISTAFRNAAGSQVGSTQTGPLQTAAGPGRVVFENVIAPGIGYSGAVLSDGPAFYWRLGESGGTVAADASGNNRPGTINGAPASVPGAISGDADTAFRMDGVDDHIVGDALTGTNLWAGGSVTMEGWARRLALVDRISLFDGGGSSPPVCDAQGNSPDVEFMSNVNVGGTLPLWVNAIPTGVYFHWALTWVEATKTAELFINGVSKGQRTTTVSSGTAGGMRLGQRANQGPARGDADEFAGYPYILSPARIAAHYAAGVSGVTQLQVSVRVGSDTNGQYVETYFDDVTVVQAPNLPTLVEIVADSGTVASVATPAGSSVAAEPAEAGQITTVAVLAGSESLVSPPDITEAGTVTTVALPTGSESLVAAGDITDTGTVASTASFARAETVVATDSVTSAAALSATSAASEAGSASSVAILAGSLAAAEAGEVASAAALAGASVAADSGAPTTVAALAGAEALAVTGALASVAVLAGAEALETRDSGVVTSGAAPAGTEALVAADALASVATLAGSSVAADSGALTTVAVPAALATATEAGDVASVAAVAGSSAAAEAGGVTTVALVVGTTPAQEAGEVAGVALLSGAAVLVDAGGAASVASAAGVGAAADAGTGVSVAVQAGVVALGEAGGILIAAAPTGAEAIADAGIGASVAGVGGVDFRTDAGGITAVAVPTSAEASVDAGTLAAVTAAAIAGATFVDAGDGASVAVLDPLDATADLGDLLTAALLEGDQRQLIDAVVESGLLVTVADLAGVQVTVEAPLDATLDRTAATAEFERVGLDVALG